MAGVDYTETFSLVVKHSTIRLVLSLAVSKKWHVRQLDVQNAFLHGYLTEQVYMRQPSRFTNKQFSNHVWNGPRQMDHLIQKLGSLFSIKDLGNLSYFLGIELKYEGDSMHLCQSKYAFDVLSRTKFTEAKPISTPVSSGQKLSAYVGDPCDDHTLYHSVVGALQYLTITRPDLSYVANQVCQFMHSPKNMHWMAIKRIFRYLKSTYDHGLLYKPRIVRLTAFSNADYAGNPDIRHSTGGFCFYLGSNLISWSSKKQKTVSRSSAQAKYRQLAYTAAKLSWLRSLYRDLHMHLVQLTIWCDNISSIALASNPVFHSRTKHLEVDYHYFREKVVHGQLLGFQILRYNREVLINTSIPQLNGYAITVKESQFLKFYIDSSENSMVLTNTSHNNGNSLVNGTDNFHL
ncbi:uncharacterized mitochondrial protein AtMg00810-like [Pyrus communis]|uniref:uncharacterized mitochondrial protein AtMg00810-like n=1 Tax=Pyrus communis TaxID=23211 RepID=UPI0035C0DC4F